VVRETMDGARPKLWTSDRYSAQQHHAEAQQTCLAHLARDLAYGVEASQEYVVLRLKLWFAAVFAFARGMAAFAPSTAPAKRRALERRIDDILHTPTDCPVARQLLAKIARARDQLLTFCDFAGAVEPTNNGCERALRPAVIQRKSLPRRRPG
jgi:transposase